VRSVSPLGITLQTCSIGPHREEFSCAEVPVMKIRVRPFASLRRGKVVIDAVLSEPSVLVAQKKDFSWLGIPAPSEDTLKRHSEEEGIDYRTKTRRLAREKASEQWYEERDKAAWEAAERGYTLRTDQSVSLSTDEMREVDGSTEVGKSSPPLCADEMHKKDHHLATGIESVLKHSDLEKSFGVKSRIAEINLWTRMISSPSRRRRKVPSKVASDIDSYSQQRILRRSADAALAYFRSIGHSNLDDSSPGTGNSSSSGGHTTVGSNETTSSNRPFSSESASRNFAKLSPDNFHSDDFACKGKSARVEPIIDTCDAFNGHSHNQLFSQCGPHSLDNDRIVYHHSEDLQLGHANFSQSHVLEKYENLSENKLVHQHEIFLGNFGSCTHAINWSSFWPYQLQELPVTFNAPYASLDVQIQKLKSHFAIGPGEISSVSSEGVNQMHPSAVHHAPPITLDSVYFNGGNLMLLGYGDNEPRFDLFIYHLVLSFLVHFLYGDIFATTSICP
jgi:hypothetical protein